MKQSSSMMPLKPPSKLKQYDSFFTFLFFLSFLLLLSLEKIWNHPSKQNYQKIYLFFSNTQYLKLQSETQFVPSHQNLKSKILSSLARLSSKPQNRSLKTIIPSKTQILNLWTSHQSLYINFSKHLITHLNLKIQDPKLLIYSILASLFYSFKHIHSIHISIENKPLKTLSGKNLFPSHYLKKIILPKIKPFFLNTLP